MESASVIIVRVWRETIRVQGGTGFIVGSQRDGNALCRDTLAGLPGLSFCRYRLRGIRDNLNMMVHFRHERNMPGPPSAVPGTAKCAGTFSPGTQHAGTAFGGTRYSKMCRYFIAGNAICRKLMRMK